MRWSKSCILWRQWGGEGFGFGWWSWWCSLSCVYCYSQGNKVIVDLKTVNFSAVGLIEKLNDDLHKNEGHDPTLTVEMEQDYESEELDSHI